MGYYWAKFREYDKHLFRFDTRIYLNEIDAIKENDRCIGAVVGKNPGSARPSDQSEEIQEIKLDGDKFLPTVHNILVKAYKAKPVNTSNYYIQVLNLFYLCEKDLKKALATIEKIEKYKESIMRDEAENEKNFPWIWYAWGGNEPKLNKYKERYKNTAEKSFYFVQKGKIVTPNVGFPLYCETARHTQGLKQEEVIKYIRQLLCKGC